jgi:hypothetical protein
MYSCGIFNVSSLWFNASGFVTGINMSDPPYARNVGGELALILFIGLALIYKVESVAMICQKHPGSVLKSGASGIITICKIGWA